MESLRDIHSAFSHRWISSARDIIIRFCTTALKNSLLMCFLKQTDSTGTAFLPLFLNIL